MGLITTQHAGFGQNKPDPKQKADPKPVRGFNYAGEPMKDGQFYNGRPEHMGPADRLRTVRVKAPMLKANQTPEYLAKMRERMALVRAKRWLGKKKQEKATPETTG